METCRLSRLLALVVPLFPSRSQVIARRRCSFLLYILFCAHVCMPHSLKVDRLVLFATFAEKPRLNADFLVFTSAKSNTIPQNSRAHTHTCVATRSTNTKFQDGWAWAPTSEGTGMTFTQYGFKLHEIGLFFTFTSFAMKNRLNLPE